jgi:hypothetical protein
MSRAARFTQAEVRTLIRAVENEGKSIAAVRIGENGRPEVLLGEPMKAPVLDSGDDWSEEIAAL